MAESLKDVVRRAHGLAATKALPDGDEAKVFPNWVLPRHHEWLTRPDSEKAWTAQAVEFAAAVLRGDFKHPRPGRISPSALGDACERLLLLGYGGHDQEPFPPMNAEKMAAGEFHHLRWQMEGISAGYMQTGEVWMHSEALRAGGSADGLLADGSLFELKSTGGHLFKALRNGHGTAYEYVMGMHAKHKLQMEAYWLIDEVGSKERGTERVFSDYGSLVYFDAGDPGAQLEFRIHSSPSRRKEVHRILEGLHDWIDLDELPDMLEGCRKSVFGKIQGDEAPTEKELTVYNRCQYRKTCPSASSVSGR